MAYAPVDNNDYDACTSFAEHTPYVALHSLVMAERYAWKDTMYETGEQYIIGRDIPQRLARVLLSEDRAKLGRTVWENQEGFEYSVGCLPNIATIYIEKGSKTDFYSVPRIFWNIYPPTGIGQKAADVHDKLCHRGTAVEVELKDGQLIRCIHPVSSSDAAEIFLEAMEVALVPKRERLLKYYAVKWFGPRFEACRETQ